MKVLFVSDSLGAPIEQRGIHNFSMSLIEVLQAEGAEVDLLVERPPSRWLAGRMKSKVVDLDVTRKSVALAEVFRFFGRRGYGTSWISLAAQRRFVSRSFLKLVGWAFVAFVRLRAGPTVKVENDPKLVDFAPPLAYHLTLPDNFVVAPAVYTEMVMRAAWGLPASTIDASGYDLAVIDTPMYFKVRGIDADRIVAVVHDIIPLRDPMMTPYWRNLFLKKLEGVLALDPNFAFVSEYSRNVFRQGFPNYGMRRSFVYYPTLRRSLVRRATAEKGRPARYAPAELANLERSLAVQNRNDAERRYESELEQRIAVGARYQREALLHENYVRLGWNSTLPYFVTVVSDEPRKNIELCVKAFAALKGRANMVVVGNVDGRRYVGDDPNMMGHIRFTGYVAEAEKTRIVAAADGLIFTSFTEGFGIPITEGALYGKPVLCSEIAVFREVAGEEAVYFDPYREETLVSAVEAVLAEPREAEARAARLRQRVLERFAVEAATARLSAFLAELGLLMRAAPPAFETVKPLPQRRGLSYEGTGT